MNIMWNNLDKLHKYSDYKKTKPLSESQEIPLHAPFDDTKKSLLQQEIEILKPDLIVFTTGPYYRNSMAAGLRVAKDDLKAFKPQKNKTITEISDLVKINIPICWTYHPAYLNRINKIHKVVKEVHNALNM